MRKDDVTAELPGVPRRRGRPPTGKAKTGAQRVREYRQRKRVEAYTVEITGEVLDALHTFQRQCEEHGHKFSLDELVDLALRDKLVRWGFSFASNR